MDAVQTFFNKVNDQVVTNHILNSTSFILTKRAALACADYNSLKFEVSNISHYAQAIDVRASFAGSAASSFAMTTYHVVATVALLFAGLAVLICQKDESVLNLAVKQFVQVGSNLAFGALSLIGVISPFIGSGFFERANAELEKIAPAAAVKGSAREVKSGILSFARTFWSVGMNTVRGNNNSPSV